MHLRYYLDKKIRVELNRLRLDSDNKKRKLSKGSYISTILMNYFEAKSPPITWTQAQTSKTIATAQSAVAQRLQVQHELHLHEGKHRRLLNNHIQLLNL